MPNKLERFNRYFQGIIDIRSSRGEVLDERVPVESPVGHVLESLQISHYAKVSLDTWTALEPSRTGIMFSGYFESPVQPDTCFEMTLRFSNLSLVYAVELHNIHDLGSNVFSYFGYGTEIQEIKSESQVELLKRQIKEIELRRKRILEGRENLKGSNYFNSILGRCIEVAVCPQCLKRCIVNQSVPFELDCSCGKLWWVTL